MGSLGDPVNAMVLSSVTYKSNVHINAWQCACVQDVRLLAAIVVLMEATTIMLDSQANKQPNACRPKASFFFGR